MPEANRYEILVKRVRALYPRFNVKKRDSSWLLPIFWLLSKVTGQSYDNFTTTIFSTMYVGPNWEKKSVDRKYRTLRHELKHIKQFHCFPLGRWAWPLNHLLMALCYLLILPFVLTMRSRLEREGYTQTLLVEFELDGPFTDERMEYNARWLSGTFGGSAYAWMWRKTAAYAWAMETMRKINAGEIRNAADRVILPGDRLLPGEDLQDRASS
jgi:hypothetical protein